MAKIDYFKEKLKVRIKDGNGILNAIVKTLQQIPKTGIEYQNFLRGI